MVQEMQTGLWDEANLAGVEERFIKRKRKLTGSRFVQTMVFGYGANPAATTSDLNQAAGAVGFQISRQGLEHRYSREAAAVLKRALNKAVERVIAADPVQIRLLRCCKAGTSGRTPAADRDQQPSRSAER
jgi:hypothetical protein